MIKVNKSYQKAINYFHEQLNELGSNTHEIILEEKLKDLNGIDNPSKNFVAEKLKKNAYMEIIYMTLFNMLESGKYSGYFYLTNIVKLLADTLENSSLSRKEIVNVLLEFIENCPTTLSDEVIIDTYEVYFHYFNKCITTKDIYAATKGDYTPMKSAIEQDQDVLSNLSNCGFEYQLDLNSVFTNISAIKENYTDIPNTYDEKNILKVFKAFLNLGVSIYVAEIIENELLSRLNKRSKTKSQVSVTKVKKTTEPQTHKYINDKEYKTLLKQVKKYYNPYTGELTTEILTSEEREYVASLIVRLGFEQYKLANFLKKTETVAKTYTYDYFKDHIEEFRFYFGEELDQVFEYMKEMETYVDDEDKEYWIMGINEELTKLQYSNRLATYEYERQLLERK